MKTSTTIEESKRLLSLCIDPETADMMHYKLFGEYQLYAVNWEAVHITDRKVMEDLIPAWSLSALCSLMPATITTHTIPYHDERTINLKLVKSSGEWSVGYDSIVRATHPDLFAACIDLIEQLVEQGYIKTKKV